MRLLELFSGTGSVRKAVGHLFTEVISIDILDKYNPTEVSDILTWNYRQFPPGYFHAIWASPPCTEYSKAKTQGVRNLPLADSIVQRTIEIIEYLKPDQWFLENPETGLLKNREFMLGIPFADFDYCKYGYSYRKRTRIWTASSVADNLCKKDCGQMVGNTHKGSCGNGYTSDTKTTSIYSGKKYSDKIYTKEEKYSIPHALILELFTAPH